MSVSFAFFPIDLVWKLHARFLGLNHTKRAIIDQLSSMIHRETARSAIDIGRLRNNDIFYREKADILRVMRPLKFARSAFSGKMFGSADNFLPEIHVSR